ncbi:MAG: hypothetical protein RIC15_00155 [Vicingaceae bacterium]
MKGVKILVVILTLIGTGIFIVYEFTYNKSKPDYAELEADYQVSAEELYNEFLADQVGSSAKYNGKMLQLSGEITKIERTDSLLIAVYVFNEGMFGDEGVRCTFLADKAQNLENADLSTNDIKGFCSGYNDVDVILEKCTLIKHD